MRLRWKHGDDCDEADDGDGDVDPEGPAPGEVGGYDASENRSGDGTCSCLVQYSVLATCIQGCRNTGVIGHRERFLPISIAAAPSTNVLYRGGEETSMILIDPLIIPAAPIPATARPAMNIADEIAAAESMDPTFISVRPRSS